MPIFFSNVTTEGGDAGISAPKGEYIQGDSFHSIGTKIGIHIRDDPSIWQQIGLPENTPPEVLLEALQTLKDIKEPSEANLRNALMNTRLGKLIGDTANLTTIGSGLWNLLKNTGAIDSDS